MKQLELIKPERLSSKTYHNMSDSPEYTAWRHMKERCYNSTCKEFYKYGGRGIRVCREWNDSFLIFYKDMGPRLSEKHSLDRINNNGDYEPDNCRWATATQQVNNRRMVKSNKSGYVGVSYEKKAYGKKKWRAQITIDYKRIHIGCYETPEEAYEAYLNKRKEVVTV